MDVRQSIPVAATPGVPTDPPPRVCGGCGYPLTGLPDDGRCPECGSSYGRDQVVLAGWAIGAHETIANVSPHRLPAVTLSNGLFLLLASVQFAYWHRWAAAVMLAFPAAGLSLMFYRRRRLLANFGIPSQARLSSEGFAQRDGCGQAKLMPWSCARVVRLGPAGPGRYRLEISEENHIGKWVAIEFESTPAQAEHLRQFIARLRSRSIGTS